MKFIFRFFIPISAIAIIFFLGKLYYSYALNLPVSSNPEKKKFVIAQGEGVSEIADHLREERLIRSASLFKIYLGLTDQTASLQAGSYLVPQNLDVKEVVEILQHGTFDIKLTFLEGWRRQEMAEYLEKKYKEATHRSYSSNEQTMASGVVEEERIKDINTEFLKLTEGTEGYLFPDTYITSEDFEVKDLVDKMRANFDKKVTVKMRADIKAKGMTLDEVVSLASIVEREESKTEDRPIVAGILIKRWKNNWPLEADATIQYALGYEELPVGEKDGWWKKKLTDHDLEIDSPYNTRKYKGLPPTPICNPSLEAIKAVIYPQETNYWFYLTGADGKTYYAKTMEEQVENMAKLSR